MFIRDNTPRSGRIIVTLDIILYIQFIYNYKTITYNTNTIAIREQYGNDYINGFKEQ